MIISKMTPELEELLKKAKEAFEKMTSEEQIAMFKAQQESWVRGEMGWPEPKFKIVNGCKVYESYEDYCND